MDLFLFYFAWELMLVPMYFLIAVWGHERRVYAAIKFFIFTQLSGLLMLVAILALFFAHHAQTGVFTFEYADLIGTRLGGASMWVMLGFFIAFAVKLPMFPFHPWLPDAHTEAPTAGSVILAALMLKTGGYGLIRFVLPLFPDDARAFAPVAMVLAVAGILYGAIVAFAQSDLKRLVAYTSVSHLGFVLLGVFAGNPIALRGAVVTMLAHGLSTGALFVVAGSLQHRLHTREMDRMGGIWSVAPNLSGAAMVATMASLGLPGLADFIGEFLVLTGTYQVSRPLAVVAAIGVLAGTFYGMKLIQQTFHGPNRNNLTLPDLAPHEALIFATMIAGLLWLGLYPRPALDIYNPAAVEQAPVSASAWEGPR
jgi:NADH-quinone oxidoreductase subunit M